MNFGCLIVVQLNKVTIMFVYVEKCYACDNFKKKFSLLEKELNNEGLEYQIVQYKDLIRQTLMV